MDFFKYTYCLDKLIGFINRISDDVYSYEKIPLPLDCRIVIRKNDDEIVLDKTIANSDDERELIDTLKKSIKNYFDKMYEKVSEQYLDAEKYGHFLVNVIDCGLESLEKELKSVCI